MTRTEKAKELLRQGELTYRQIAEQTGLSHNYVKRLASDLKKALRKTEEKPAHEIQIERERIRRQVAEQKYIQLKKTLARDENIIQALKTVIPQFPVPEKIEPPRPIVRKTKETAVLLVSDWHIGEVVSEEETLGLGGFNAEIATARVELIAEKTIDLITGYTRSRIDTLVVGALGDMVSGQIHEELERTQDLNAAEQVYVAALLLAYLLDELSAYFNIKVVAVVGNHGRLKQKKEAKEKYVNWDYIVYQIASLLLRDNKRIEWNISKSPHAFVEIEGHLFLFTHGDSIRSWAGIPWYGISRYANNMRELLNKKGMILDGLCMGHFHQPANVARINGPIVVNGSLKGPDEHSFQYGAAMQASQTLFGVSKEYPETFRYTLWLDERERPTRWDVSVPQVWGNVEVF